MDIEITPGTMDVCQLAIDLFGVERIVPSGWLTPVHVKDLTAEEVGFAKNFFAEFERNVTTIKTP